jgi:hypothetical protein
MHERTRIELSRADRAELEAVIANRNSPQKHVWRAKIVLLTADDHGTVEIMRRTGKAKTVIWRWLANSAARPGDCRARAEFDADGPSADAHLCVPKIRFCNIGDEVRQGQAVN